MPLTPLREVLANGVTVIAQENHTVPAVSLLAVLRAGGYDDPDEREGTAALLARVLDRGTTMRTADQIADDLDGRGASLSVSAGRHQVGVSATCLVDDFAPVLSIVADVLRNPVFPEHDVATRRGEIVTTIRQDEDDPASVAVNRFFRELYGTHPYARRVRGTVESVERLTRDDLVRFRQRHFAPAGLTVVVVGGLRAGDMLAQVAEALGAWPSGPAIPPLQVPDAPPPAARCQVVVAMPDKSQSDVAYGFVGIRRADPGFMAASVMNNALGQYALGGRLGDSIRERQGMAYYVFSSLDAGQGPGPLMIRAGVAAENVARTIASIDTELDTIRLGGFTEKEIAESKQYLVGSLPRQLETNAGIAAFLLNAELFDLGPDYDRMLPDLVRAVTRDAAVAAARRLLDPQRATVVVAGPSAAEPRS
jgi:zinc protease